MYNKNSNMSAPSQIPEMNVSAKQLKKSLPINVSAKQMQPTTEEPASAAIMAPKCSYAVQREKTWIDGRTYFEYVPEWLRFKALRALPEEVIEARKEAHLEQLKETDKRCGFNSIKEQNEMYFRNMRKDTKLKKCVLTRAKHGWGRPTPADRATYRSLERFSRNTLLNDYSLDFDIENAQAVIICNCAIDEHTPCLALQQYCETRKVILARGMEKYKKSRDVIKKVWTKLLNGGGIPEWYDEPLAHKVQKEIWTIRTKIKQANPELFESMRQKCAKDPEKNRDEESLQKATMRSMMAVWFQHYEVKIVANVLEWCEKEGLLTMEGPAYKDKLVFAYMYDGFILYSDICDKWGKKTGKDGNELLKMFSAITTETTGFDLVWTCKPFEEKFDIQDKMIEIMAAPATLTESKKLTGEMQFEEMMEEFQKSRCFIQDIGAYLDVLPGNEIKQRSTTDMRNAYARLWCGYDEKGKKKHFIDLWMKDNDDLRCYDRMNIYPNAEMCPPNEFNIWTPFAMELVEDFEWNEKGLNEFIYFMKHVICGHKEYKGEVDFPTPQYDYLMDWLAHIVQRPEQKCGKCPVLISKQGAGKGTLMRIIKRIIGEKRVFQSVKPDRDVWGDFNPMMEEAILVVLDESDKKKASEAESTLKNYITEQKMTINNKHVVPHDITSLHRFMIHTNQPDGGVCMQDGDRRFFVLRMSDHKKGDLAYWAGWNRLLEDFTDNNVWKTIYDWLMARDIGDFMQKTTPKTEFQINLETSSKEPLDCWMEDKVSSWRKMSEDARKIVGAHNDKGLSGEEVYMDYMSFCERNGFEKKLFFTNSNGLSSRINNHEIATWGGVTGTALATQVKRGGGCNHRVFRMHEMWNYYVAKGVFREEDYDGSVENMNEDAAPVLPPAAAPVMVEKKKVKLVKQIKGQQALKLGAQPDDVESEAE